MDDDPEVALEHLVDRPPHLVGIRAVTDDPAGHDVRKAPRACRPPSDPLDDQHVPARLKPQALRFAGRCRPDPVPSLLGAGLHPGRADRVGDAEVQVQAVGDPGPVGHVRPGSPEPADKPLPLQGPERLAKGSAGDAELGGELGF
jgi:hypothetical protein